MNAIFSYKESKIYIQCNLDDKVLDICQKFSSKINQEVESKIFIFMGKVLNLDSTLSEQLYESIDKNSDIKDIFIQVYDSNKETVLIKYNYEGENKEVELKKEDNILKRISSLIKQPYEKINILYNGAKASRDDFNKNFDGLANSQNKENNTMSLLIFDRSKTIEEQENKENDKKGDDKTDKKDDVSKDKKNERKYVVKEFIKFLKKLYYILIIQYSCILIVGLLGFYFKINEIFTQNLGSILGTFIPITLTSLAGSYFFSPKDIREKLKEYIIYTFLSLFVVIIIFYCFLLSKYVDKNYITCGIILFFTDIFCSMLYCTIFKEYRGIFIVLISSIFNIITILMYFKYIFEEINGTKITILIIMALLMILYIILYSVLIRIFVTDDEFCLAAFNFNYLFFTPILLAIIFVPIFLGFLIFILGALIFLGIFSASLIIHLALFRALK